ncbi:hypothetical protein BBC27_08730 [Acidithiobacillus ferrivorans]|uniref:Uncharacterized protein n=1 Tax=Acidithiobacillus ferrivorans TaxID=160808 RepID=A0A1B9BZX2_9PROT|nr:hypothetical protein [Acidithiobacillus ferrivorans]OCB03269.1 hypothetical protein BBC27_08730 [Acidithiobacillus ferrivorans]
MLIDRIINISTVIAIAVVIIAYRQWKTASATLKLELYKRRFNIYLSVLDLYQATMKGSLADMEKSAIPFIMSFRESLFLFDEKDGIYKTLEIIKDEYSKIEAYEKAEADSDDSDDSERIAERARASNGSYTRLEERLLKLEEQLKKYLDFSKIK